MAFESAVDELAEKLGIDPVALRLRNDLGELGARGTGRLWRMGFTTRWAVR